MAESTQQRERKDSLLSRLEELEESGRSKVIKIRARRAKIRPEYVGHTFGVFNGHDYTNVHIDDEMVGRTFGKVAPRRRPTARAKYLRIAPSKMRQVAGLVSQMPVEQALGILNFTPKKAAHQLAKILKSAVANKLSLEGTSHLDPEDLRISRIVVEGAPTAKRIQFRSMGRVYRVRKRFCHVNVYLGVKAGAPTAEEAGAKGRAKKAAEKATPAKKKTATKRKTAKTAAKKKTAKTAAKKATAKKTTEKAAEKKSAAKKTAETSAEKKAAKPAAKKKTEKSEDEAAAKKTTAKKASDDKSEK